MSATAALTSLAVGLLRDVAHVARHVAPLLGTAVGTLYRPFRRRVLALKLRWQFIQAFRLAGAIQESSFEVHVPESEADKFAVLNRYLGLPYVVGTGGVPTLPDTDFVHHDADPVTWIGGLERPLIFPRAMVRRCREKWDERRPYTFSFCGLVTDERKNVLEEWARRSGSELRLTRSFAQRVANRVLPNYVCRFRHSGAGLTIWDSRRGRTWPGKVWDDVYYSILGKTRFVLCPNGQFIWTYRFFESVLSGAVPVVEEGCDSYAGFAYYLLSDDAAGLKRERDMVEHNFALAEKLVTVPSEELDERLSALMDRAPSLESRR